MTMLASIGVAWGWITNRSFSLNEFSHSSVPPGTDIFSPFRFSPGQLELNRFFIAAHFTGFDGRKLVATFYPLGRISCQPGGAGITLHFHGSHGPVGIHCYDDYHRGFHW